jgi:hypothetical protein
MTRSEYIRKEALRFFEWCPFNLSRLVDGMSADDKIAFESGALPTALTVAVEGIWLERLQNSLHADDFYSAVRTALPSESDFNLFMQCRVEKTSQIPKRIGNAIRKECARRAKENQAAFASNGGADLLKTYLRVWQSQSIALNRLIVDAWGYKRRAGGGASVGATDIDVERMMLSEAEATGSAMKVTALLPFIRSLWEEKTTVFVRTSGLKAHAKGQHSGGEFERQTVPNPEMNEERLNRFLIKLGRALAQTTKRRNLPDWTHMDQTITLIVHGWRESIYVDGLRWPILCFLSTPALAKFLSMCKPSRWKEHQDPRTLERRIERLGLVRLPAGRIQHVARRAGNFVLC